MKCLLAVLLLVLTPALACIAPSGTEPLLPGSAWTCTSLRGKAIEAGEGEGQGAPTLEFDGSGASGHAGVNRWFSRAVEIESGTGSLRIDGIGATRMAGPPERMELERGFLLALEAVDGYRVERGQLQLLADDVVVMELAPSR